MTNILPQNSDFSQFLSHAHSRSAEVNDVICTVNRTSTFIFSNFRNPGPTKQTCERNHQVILELHKQHVDMIRQIRRAIQHINHLLPTEKRLPRPFGRKRFLLPIGGNLLHALFGTTTDDDLRPLKDHISRIAKGISTTHPRLHIL